MEPNLSFISYSRKDSSFAVKLASDLKTAGVNVWLDQLDIAPGEPYDIAIVQALAQADCMLVVLSATSVQSDNVLNEIENAKNKGKRIIPLRIDDCEVPLSLIRKQWIDFTQDYNTAFQRLAKALKPSANISVPDTPTNTTINGNNQAADNKKQRNDVSNHDTLFKLNVPLLTGIVVVLGIILFLLYWGKNSNTTTAIPQPNKPDSGAIAIKDSAIAPVIHDSSTINNTAAATTQQGADTTSLRPRVYISFAAGNSISNTEVVEKLKEAGFPVAATPGVRTTRESNTVSVNYYYAADKAEAEKLLQLLKDICKPILLTGNTKIVRGNARRRHYDVWLAVK